MAPTPAPLEGALAPARPLRAEQRAAGKLQVPDAQAWAERKPRAKERAFSTSPQSSLESRSGSASREQRAATGSQGRFIPALARGCA